MPRTIVLEDGTEIELPDDKVAEIEQQAIDKFKEEAGDPEELKAQIDEKDQAVADLEDKIKVAAEKGENATKLREQLKAAEKERDEAKLAGEAKDQNANNLLIEEWKDRAVSKVTDDPKVREAFEGYYKLLENMPSNTKAEIEDRIQKAMTLAVPGWQGQEPDMGAFSSGNARGGQQKDDTKWSEHQKNVAASLGIGDDALEKYGKGGK
jgi:hypothetical protein